MCIRDRIYTNMKDSNNEREKRVDDERLSVENHLRIDERMAIWSPYGLNLTGRIHPPHQFMEICFSYHLSNQVPVEVRAMFERGKATMSYEALLFGTMSQLEWYQ